MGRGMGEIGGGHLYTAEVLLKKKNIHVVFTLHFYLVILVFISVLV